VSVGLGPSLGGWFVGRGRSAAAWKPARIDRGDDAAVDEQVAAGDEAGVQQVRGGGGDLVSGAARPAADCSIMAW
jgi:hypothetical protein